MQDLGKAPRPLSLGDQCELTGVSFGFDDACPVGLVRGAGEECAQRVLAMVACRIAGISYNASLGMLSPFIAAWMAVILLVVYVPDLVLWLPRLMR